MTKKSVILVSIILYFGVILITSSPFQHNSIFNNDANFSIKDNSQFVYATSDGGGDGGDGDGGDGDGGDGDGGDGDGGDGDGGDGDGGRR